VAIIYVLSLGFQDYNLTFIQAFIVHAPYTHIEVKFMQRTFNSIY